MAIYAIGDVHGCLPELQKLLKTITFNQDCDKLWFTGDIVGRGDYSLKTLRFIKSLGESASTVLGNHDIYLLYLQYHHKLINNFPTLRSILAASDAADLLYWVRQQPLLHHDIDNGFVIVHAGILPTWTLDEAKAYAKEVEDVLRGNSYADFLSKIEGNKPDSWSENLTGFDRLRFIINVFTRMRFCNAESHLNLTCTTELGKQPPSYMPWFTVPNRKTKNVKIVYGHWAALMGNTYEPLVYGIDTGCVYGNKLTALRLDDEKKFFV